ncbi:hypothetical protein SAMN02745229_02328 [Butyrivibrio fibrisolvens DSM 3071]|uniref:Uncharacterized protein n=1 Tax=Butyrivibrio fibrisolvens DSM 3071 TaxID=1121131 RepID=A0A1M5ZJD9_BUTFI|nr:hypothetical protein [Butyrivibrio fibrisolvens]SHI24282.1 hypothetical protein SAMN02745229_02328 [Butyrivibrio fibrisolvens DSM 3071]
MLRIEDVEKITKHVVYCGGQKVFFFDKNMKEEIIRAKDYIRSNMKKATKHLFSHRVNFMENHDGFAIIFRSLSWRKTEIWMPCLAFYYHNDWFVVSIQNVYCKECGWKGQIACPTVEDAVIGLKNEKERMNELYRLPFLGCPECGGKLSSNAIWIDTED